ncbi:MAG: hypothetical protein ACOX1F_03035 [Erysipelotrichaceae bacterium]|jgi:hypothetical protein
MKREEKEMIVRSFFEDENYRHLSSTMCEPEMESAIETYLFGLSKNQTIESLELVRLVSCLGIDKSPALKKAVFIALDLWADNHFDTSCQISGKVEAYLLRVSQCLEDYLSYGKYVNPVGLRHIEILKQYLNKAFIEDYKADLWLKYFPESFEPGYRHSYFSVIFLKMMLAEEHSDIFSPTRLDTKPLSMLAVCGYHYIAFSGVNPVRSLERQNFIEAENIESIFFSVMKLTVKYKLYYFGNHQIFRYALAFYINCCLHRQLVDLLLMDDEEFNCLVCEMLLRNLTVNNSSYQQEHRDNLLTLVKSIPEHTMKNCREQWNLVLKESRKQNVF